MVFLPGEVVVDYSIRLKKELDGSRLWINAYANDAPCYIPSERVLKEGGYEALSAMYYYDRPGAFQTGLENQIVGAVREQLEKTFPAPFESGKTSGTRPKSPQQSLALLQTTSNLRVDLVVAEPLIADPVAIDFGRDGGLWVAEMHDYPDGISAAGGDEKVSKGHVPGGRIRLVRDSDGDGQFDKSTIFLDQIPMPTGVTVWKNGVLVCSAPDILYAEDTDGDDKADIVQKLYSGFGTSNNQARVNSLVSGLDGWIYGSCGLFGGTITNFKGEKYPLGDRDFRIKPATGEIEAATGRTQQGRVRDDFGNWFGCDNTNLAYHYPLSEHYLKRNPYIAAPTNRVNLVQTEDARTLFAARSDAQRFQLSGAPGTVTAACGIGVYRDSALGPDYEQNLFVCEPVNLLVHRMRLKPKGTSFVAERPANEVATEFLRSSDPWFRPVQAVTGPDGGLWVVDMYRFVIEDPRWIPQAELEPLDVRAGSTLGRIYRVTAADVRTPPAAWFAQTKSGTGPSDLNRPQSSVFQEWDIQRLARSPGAPSDAVPPELIATWREETVRAEPVQKIRSYCKLAALGELASGDIQRALADSDPRVRRFGMTLAERSSSRLPFLDSIIQLAGDEDPQVRLQAACSLGEWQDAGADADVRVGTTLARLALRDSSNPYIVAAVYSSLTRRNLASFTTALFEDLGGKEPPPSLMAKFLATAVGYADDTAIKRALVAVAGTGDKHPQAWQLNAIGDLVESLSQRTKGAVTDVAVQDAIQKMQDAAREIVVDESLNEKLRLAAIGLLGTDSTRQADDLKRLSQLLSPANPPSLQRASVLGLERISSESVPEILAARYRDVSPSVQPQIVDTILSRDAWYPLFFDELARGTIPATSITAAQRQELVGHPTASIRERANQVFAGSISADRQKVVQEYQTALGLKGDLERGRALFAKNCAQCHKLGDVGHAVGPNLATVANKTRPFLLQEIFDPNRNVDTRYTAYVAVTKTGLIRTGLLSSESASSITLLAAEGKPHTLLRSELEELRATGKSLMPEGIEKELTPQAVADVIEFLGSAPVPPKQLEGNVPVTVKPNQGRLGLQAAQASIYGDQITFERPFGNIGYWHGVQDHVVWTVDVERKAEFDVYLEGACDPAAAGNAFRLEVGDKVITGQIGSTGGWDKYVVSRLGSISVAAGNQRIIMRPAGTAIRGALVDLKGIYFVPVGEVFAMKQEKQPTASSDLDDVARRILDDSLKESDRQALIAQHPKDAATLIVAMTRGMPDETKEEYRRIPWIWRVAVACGKRDLADEMIQVLEVSLPLQDRPLRDWQAVVIGGGIINGIGLKHGWPKSRLDEILRDKKELLGRWNRLLEQASVMADDERVNTGTRYDALRIVALDDWMLRKKQLAKYLEKGVHDELQQGAISGLSDVESDQISPLLIENFGHFSEENQGLALGALLRTEGRSQALLEAIRSSRISVNQLPEIQRKKLRESTDEGLRKRALKILGD